MVSFQTFQKISTLTLNKIETLAVEVDLGKRKLVVVSIYRPPETSLNETMNDLELILNQLDAEEVLLAGDVNINLLAENSFKQKYLDKILKHNLTQTVQCPTRITVNSSTLIDHVLSNIPTIRSFTTHHCLADHQTVLSVWGYVNPKNENKKEPTRTLTETLKKLHYEKTNSKIFQVNWRKWEIEQKN